MTLRFMAAASSADVEGLLEVLAPDVTLVTDGGGIRKAALRPIHTADKVARWLLGVLTRPDVAHLGADLRFVNGELAIVATSRDGVDSVLFLTVENDRITALHSIRNPEKLTAV